MQEQGLQRKMGFWAIWALGVGAVVGDGMFLIVASGAEAAGPAAAVAYLIAGVILMLICMNVCDLAVGMPSEGSLYDWNKRILGPRAGLIAAFGEMAMNIIFLGSVGLGTGYLSNYFFQWTDNPDISAVIWGILFLVVICGVALLGGDITGKAQLILVAVLVGIMVAFIIGGIFSGKIEPANYEPFAPHGMKGIWVAVCAGTYAYMGPLALVTTSGEVKRPEILPKAMFWAFLTIILMYIIAMVVCFGLVDYTEFSTMASPFTVAAAAAFGQWAGLVINFAAWVAVITCLVGEIFTVSRLMYGMAKEKAMPDVFAKLNKKGVPYVGVIFGLIVGIALVFMGTIAALGNVYVMLANVASACGIVCMFVTLISSWIYKKKYAEEYNAMPWKMPAKTLSVVVGLIGCAILMWSLFGSSIPTLVATLVVFALLLVFFQFYAKPRIDSKAE